VALFERLPLNMDASSLYPLRACIEAQAARWQAALLFGELRR